MQFLANIDLNSNELRNAKIHLLGTDPSSPADGTVWVNTTSNLLKIRLGGVTIPLGRLDQMAAPTGALSMNSQRITNLADPTAAQDAATKAYIDAAISGLNWKDEVRVATAAAGTLASSFAAGQVVDGVTLVTGDRILIKNQATGAENGIYVVAASGAPTRATDSDSASKILSAAVFVMEGTASADTAWVMSTNAPITLGTTALTFVKFAGGATGSVNKFAANVGDGVSTTVSVAHNLATRDITVQVYQNSTPWAQVFPDIQYTDANNVAMLFATAPASSAYRVVVTG